MFVSQPPTTRVKIRCDYQMARSGYSGAFAELKTNHSMSIEGATVSHADEDSVYVADPNGIRLRQIVAVKRGSGRDMERCLGGLLRETAHSMYIVG
jgi:hypothetical protein